MSKYKEVEDQVKSAILSGTSEIEIKTKLIEVGYNEEDIFQIIRDAKSAMTPPSSKTVNPPVAPVVTPPMQANPPVSPMPPAPPKPPAPPAPPVPQPPHTPPVPPMPPKPEPAPVYNSPFYVEETEAIPAQKPPAPPAPSAPAMAPNLDPAPPAPAPVSSPVPAPSTMASTPIPPTSAPVNDQATIVSEGVVKKEKTRGGFLKKFIITVVILLLLSGGSAFAYYKVDPFFMKDLSKVIEDSFSETYNAMVTKDYSGEAEYNIDMTFIVAGFENNVNLKIPFSFQSDYVDDSTVNGYVKFGDIDLGPVIKDAMEALESVDSEHVMTDIGESMFGFEMKVVNDKLFFNLNKIPDFALAMAPFIEEYLNTWVFAPIDELEDSSNVNITMNDEPLTPEEMEYVIDRLNKAILVDANPTISPKRVGGKLEVSYSANNLDLYKAVESALIDIDKELYEGELTKEFPTEGFDYEMITGEFIAKLTINKDLLFEKVEAEINTASNNFKMKFGSRGSLDFESPVEIKEPIGAIPFEEVMASLNYGIPEGEFDQSVEVDSLEDDLEFEELYNDDFGNE